jgi:hypothetical protein
MYTGTLIDDLFAAVERAEYHARAEQETAELEQLLAELPYGLLNLEQNFLGVA